MFYSSTLFKNLFALNECTKQFDIFSIFMTECAQSFIKIGQIFYFCQLRKHRFQNVHTLCSKGADLADIKVYKKLLYELSKNLFK